jgi:uncharacterized membrane protein YraQ (UPF0718 family)
MKGKMVIAILIGVVIGLVSSSFLKQSEAQGQVKQEKQTWEYKEVPFVVTQANDEHTKKITDLASEGWEYVGLVGSGPSGSSQGFMSVGNVLFKRLKK